MPDVFEERAFWYGTRETFRPFPNVVQTDRDHFGKRVDVLVPATIEIADKQQVVVFWGGPEVGRLTDAETDFA